MREKIGPHESKRKRVTVLVEAIIVAIFLLLTGCGKDQYAQSAGKQSAGAQKAKQKQGQKAQEAGTKAKAQGSAGSVETKEDKGKYYIARDEFTCRGVTVRSVVRCKKEDTNGPLWQILCDQELYIGDKRLAVPGGGNTMGWACIQDPRTSTYHPVIEFLSGGNHWEAEWTAVYDLKGNLVLTDIIDATKCDKKRSRYVETEDGFVDEYAVRGCSAEAVREREKNKRKVDALKRGHEKEFNGIYFGEEE